MGCRQNDGKWFRVNLEANQYEVRTLSYCMSEIDLKRNLIWWKQYIWARICVFACASNSYACVCYEVHSIYSFDIVQTDLSYFVCVMKSNNLLYTFIAKYAFLISNQVLKRKTSFHWCWEHGCLWMELRWLPYPQHDVTGWQKAFPLRGCNRTDF